MTQFMFKAGDRVRYVGRPSALLRQGREYTVKVQLGNLLKIVGTYEDGTPPYNGVTVTNFKLAETTPMTPPKVRPLKGDVKIIFEALVDGEKYTAEALQARVQGFGGRAVSLPTVTARIRDLRKPSFGGFKIEHTQVGKHHIYQLVA